MLPPIQGLVALSPKCRQDNYSQGLAGPVKDFLWPPAVAVRQAGRLILRLFLSQLHLAGKGAGVHQVAAKHSSVGDNQHCVGIVHGVSVRGAAFCLLLSGPAGAWQLPPDSRPRLCCWILWPATPGSCSPRFCAARSPGHPLGPWLRSAYAPPSTL